MTAATCLKLISDSLRGGRFILNKLFGHRCFFRLIILREYFLLLNITMAFLPSGMQHVERTALYTSLRARVRFLENFIDFGLDDLRALEEGQNVIKAAIPGIVESVYQKLLAYDVTARVFSSRDSRQEDDPEVWANINSAAIQNRKIFLRWYLTKLNSDPTRHAYSMSRISMASANQ